MSGESIGRQPGRLCCMPDVPAVDRIAIDKATTAGGFRILYREMDGRVGDDEGMKLGFRIAARAWSSSAAGCRFAVMVN